jgi:hypothetical protein
MERYIHTYIHTDKVTWLFFSAYAIISFALRARNNLEIIFSLLTPLLAKDSDPT